MKTIGEKLRKERELLGHSQAMVEKHTGINRSTLSFYENSEREVSLTNLNKLSTFYGKTLSYFLDENNKEEKPLTVSYRVSAAATEDTIERLEWGKLFITTLYEMKNLI